MTNAEHDPMDDLIEEMIEPAPPPEARQRRRRLVSTVAVLGLAGIGLTSLTTGAIFTDNEDVGGAITTGTVDIAAGDLTFVAPAVNLAPGDSSFATVAVTNSGSLALRYAVSYAAPAAPAPSPAPTITPSPTPGYLGSQLTLRVYDPTATCTAEGTASLEPLAPAVTPLTEDGGLLLGNASEGGQEGDRTLPSTASEPLCVRLDLAKDADNAYQNTAVDLKLHFAAEQVVNNP